MLPITLGPLPTAPGRLQFKVLQTYDNGEVDSWIADWSVGAPEPDNPGPVLDLVEGGPGTIPDTTVPDVTTVPTSAVSTTSAGPSTTATPGTIRGTVPSSEESDDSDSNLLPIIIQS